MVSHRAAAVDREAYHDGAELSDEIDL